MSDSCPPAPPKTPYSELCLSEAVKTRLAGVEELRATIESSVAGFRCNAKRPGIEWDGAAAP